MQRLIQKLPRLAVVILLVIGTVLPVATSTHAWADAACVPDAVSGTANNTCLVGDKAGDKKADRSCADINNCDLIKRFIVPFVNFLVAFFGLVLVISIVIGGIQLGTSAGDPQKAAAGKARIRNAVIALAAFVLLYGALNFLIPGGLI